MTAWCVTWVLVYGSVWFGTTGGELKLKLWFAEQIVSLLSSSVIILQQEKDKSDLHFTMYCRLQITSETKLFNSAAIHFHI